MKIASMSECEREAKNVENSSVGSKAVTEHT